MLLQMTPNKSMLIEISVGRCGFHSRLHTDVMFSSSQSWTFKSDDLFVSRFLSAARCRLSHLGQAHLFHAVFINPCWRCMFLQTADMFQLFLAFNFQFYVSTLCFQSGWFRQEKFRLKIPGFVATNAAGDERTCSNIQYLFLTLTNVRNRVSDCRHAQLRCHCEGCLDIRRIHKNDVIAKNINIREKKFL